MVSSRFFSWLMERFSQALSLPLPQDNGQGVSSYLEFAILCFSLNLLFFALKVIVGEFFDGQIETTTTSETVSAPIYRDGIRVGSRSVSTSSKRRGFRK